MSHFVGLCFGDNWENDLENYYEGLEVDEYLIYTKEEAIKEAMLQHECNYNHALKMVNEVGDDAKQRYLEVIEQGPFISKEQAWEDVKTWGYRINEYDELVSIFVLGDKEVKKARIMKKYDKNEFMAERMMREKDTERKQYHNSFCEGKWGDSRNYNISVNSSVLGIEETAELLIDFIDRKRNR